MSICLARDCRGKQGLGARCGRESPRAKKRWDAATTRPLRDHGDGLMCGIAGVLTRDRSAGVDRRRLKAMADAIAHRGPDADGFFTDDHGVGLAHRRLSIIDLAGGDQPIGNEDGTIQIVFNGEIYNYRALRSRLEKKGHLFRTHSDTETLVHLYEELGRDLVKELRGMFAFALWDRNEQVLLLARDRFGQKPLYYSFNGERLLFGSEIKAILAYGGVSREVDPQALEDYLAFGFVPGGQSIFSEIRKLEPASTMLVNAARWEESRIRYWHLRGEVDSNRTAEDWQEVVSEKFSESIAAHRVADVPIGSFLSGGLDSSAVTAVLAGMGTEPVRTFSMGFEERRFSELDYARVVADRFGTRHVEEIVTADAIESLAALTHSYDEPFADASAIPTMRVSQLARQHVKVVLSGDGGDEAFGGYSRYAHDLKEAAIREHLPKSIRHRLLGPLATIWPKADWLPRILRLKTVLTNLSLDPAAAYANTLCLCRLPLRKQLLSSSLKGRLSGYVAERQVIESFGPHGDDPLRGMLASDLHMMLPCDFLTKVDRASMAHGLEVRPPLVDHELMELAWTVPSRWKIRDGETKWLFKKLSERWLPHDIIYRKKQGFEIPIDNWLRGPLQNLFEETVLSSRSPLGEYLDLAVVRRLYSQHRNRSGRHGNLLWSILVLGAWMDRYLGAATAKLAIGPTDISKQVVTSE